MEGRYTIILLPDKITQDLVLNIRKDLSVMIDLPSVPPHITLREDFYSEDIEKLIDEYQDEIPKIGPLQLKITGLEVFNNKIVVFIIEKRDILQNLHEKTVITSQKYVSTPKKINFDINLNEEQKELVRKYQLPFYFKYYNPHMTLAILKTPKDREKILNLIYKYDLPKSIQISQICIYDKINHKPYKLIEL